MFRTSLRARRGRLGSSFAMALALAGGTAVCLSAAAPAYAKDKKDEAKPEAKGKYSAGFIAAYKPVETIVNGAKDDATKLEPARALVPPMVAAVTNDDERLAAGQMVLNLGVKLADKDFQRQGLILQLDSGKVPPERLAQFNYFAGSLSWDKKDYPAAQKYFTQAFNLGYTGDDIDRLVPETYFEQKQDAQGLAELKRMEQVREAKGSMLGEDAMRRGLQVAYEDRDAAQTTDFAAMVARHYPRPEIWNIALTVLADTYDLTGDESVDIYRLLKLNDALKNTREYVDYINAVDPRRMSNEALPIIQEGIAKGALKPTDAFVKENLQIATQRAPQDKAQAAEIEKDGRAGANGVPARAAGDNYLSIGNPQKAVEMYQLAAQKGGVDASQIQMRLGVAQTEAGNYDAARQQFQQVTGKRQPIAKMWLAYIDAKQSPPPAAPAAAPAAAK